MGMAEQQIQLSQHSYHGIILEDKDNVTQGRYRVHIAELHPLIGQDKGILCKNQSHPWRWGPSNDFMYGQYWPLQPGTKVIVKFYEDDFQTGYIDRIISDQVKNTTPKLGCGSNPEATTDRDDVYVMFKTPKKHNLFTVLEDTSDSGLGKIPNSIHLYYNYRRSTMILNEDGIHWFTMDNRGVTVEGNNNEWIDASEKVYVKQDRDIYVAGSSSKHYSSGDYDMKCKGSARMSSQGQFSTTSSAMISEDAPLIMMNCGVSQQAKKAKVNKGEDEIVVQKKIDMRVVAHQNKDDTYYGEQKYSIIGGTPAKGEADSSKSRLSKGMNDRHSSVGAEQCGATIRQPPPYPSDGGEGGLGGLGGLGGVSGLLSAATGGGSGVLGQISSASSALSGVSGVGNLSGSVSQITGGLTSGSSVLNSVSGSGVTGGFSSLVGGMTGGLSNLSSNLTSSLGGLDSISGLSGISGNLTSSLSGLTSTSSITDLTSNLSGMTGLMDSIGSFGGVDQFTSTVSDVVSGNSTSGLSSFSSVTDLFGGSIGIDSLFEGGLTDSLTSTSANSLTSDLMSGISDSLSSLTSLSPASIGSTIQEYATSASSTITSGFSSASSFINSGIDTAIQYGIDTASEYFPDLKTIGTSIATLPGSLISGANTELTDLLDVIANPISELASCTDAIISIPGQLVGSVLSGLTGGANSIIGSITGGISGLVNGTMQKLQQALTLGSIGGLNLSGSSVSTNSGCHWLTPDSLSST